MTFGRRAGGVFILLLLATGLCAQEVPAPEPALQARIRSAFDAWKSATTDEARTAVRKEYGPYDADFHKYLSGWGEAFQKGGDLKGAIDRFSFCATESVVSGDMFHATICWQLIAGTERLQGNFADAEKHYKISLDYARKPGGEVRIPYVLNNMAAVYVSQARYGEGLDMLYQAVEYHKRSERGEDPAPYQNMAIAHALRGDLARSLQSFTRALEIYEKRGDTKKLGLTHYNLGILQMKQGNHEAAAHEFEVSRELSEKAGDKTQLALTLGDYGFTRDLQGQKAEALRAIRQALELCTEMGYKQGCNDALVNLGNLHLRHAELPEAAAAFQRAWEIAGKELHDPYSVGQALRGLAYTAQKRGDYPKVLEYSTAASETAQNIGDIAGNWQASALSGIALRATGKIAEARSAFEAAIGLIEKQRGMVAGGDVEKQRFFEQAAYPYRELAVLEVEAGNPLAALRAAERARARVLLDVLAGSPERVDQPMSQSEREEEKSLRAAISVMNSRLQTAKPAVAAQIRHERDSAWQEYEAFLQQIYAKYPQLRAWRGDSPVATESDLAKLVASPGTAIVEFLCAQDELLEFVISAGKDTSKPRISVYRIPVSRDAVSLRAEKYRNMIESRDPAFRAEAHALYSLLLGPAAAELRGKTRVRLIPDGPLWNLPFQALTDGTGKFWIETTTLSSAHSITFLRNEAARPKSPRSTSQELVVLADPARTDANRIPALTDQARRIAALYDPRRQTLLLGAEANEKAFQKLAPQARVIHVAAHGLVDPVNGLHSRLLLTPGAAVSDTPDDGWLEAWELMQMHLNADLVVLSACETGRGRAADGEGLLGLTWSLFVSGARSAVVSQWRVESESTTELMVGLHQRLRQGEAGDAALRGAILALMKNPNYRHPMYWAPFIYSGQ